MLRHPGAAFRPLTYADIGEWMYREPATSEAFNLVAAVVVSMGSMFAMGLFFLIAGMLTPGPLRRKGPRRFLADRAIGLGIPFLAYLLLIYPLAEWAGERHGPASQYLGDALADPDPGAMWFVGVLLLFTIAYVGWRWLRPAPAERRPLRPALVVGLAGAIAVGSIVMRLQFPIDSVQPFSAHLWQWPQCLAMFVLGLMAGEQGWLQPVPRPYARWAAGQRWRAWRCSCRPWPAGPTSRSSPAGWRGRRSSPPALKASSPWGSRWACSACSSAETTTPDR